MASPHHHKFIGAVEDEWQLYSDNEQDYTIGDPIGFGASSVVYSALYQSPEQPPIPCALKVLDLDRLPQHALRLLERETQLMSLAKHPNVLRVRGTWTAGHKLYIAMRLMCSGSASDVIRYGWPGGMEEEVVKTILKQALEGLNYLHINGLIHRDIKAANLLIDTDGTVLLGDLGVAAFLWDSEDSASPSSIPDHRRMVSFDPNVTLNGSSAAAQPRPRIGGRKSFVGTPCWMAPEVIQGKKYDAKADIWSFGITALELTQGRPPRSQEAPQKVLLKTVQDAPPMLDRTGGTFKYSRTLYEIVESCLIKDPAKRPSAAQLLQTPFFRGAKRKNYLINTVLKDLPPLVLRQERRKRSAPSTLHNTVESWDFSVTHQASPSAFRRSLSLTSTGSREGPKMLDIDEDASDVEEVESESDSDNLSPSQIPVVGTGCLNTKTPPTFSPSAPLSMPVSIASENLPSTPALLPCLTPQSTNSKSNSELPTPPSSPGSNSVSKRWLRLSRPIGKKLVSDKGLVSGASDAVRSISSAFKSTN